MEDGDLLAGALRKGYQGVGRLRFEIEGMEIDWEEVGAGKPVIMLHGFPLDRKVMKGCMEPIFEARPGYRRIYLDLPGMGKSTVSDYIQTCDDMLDVLIRFIDEVVPKESYLLVGHSFGGLMSRGIILRQRERVDGLLLLCPLIVPQDNLRKIPLREDADLPIVPYNQLESDEEILSTFCQVVNEKVLERYRAEIRPNLEGQNEFIERFRREGYHFSFDVDDLDPPFRRPTLIITGRQDYTVGYEDAYGILGNYPGAAFAVVDGAGHYLQVERESTFQDLVRDWLERVEDSN
jgi:pimeloyl-ACP methyl ester carboxylesterase